MMGYVTDDRFTVEVEAFDGLAGLYGVEGALVFLSADLAEEGLVLTDSQCDALALRWAIG